MLFKQLSSGKFIVIIQILDLFFIFVNKKQNLMLKNRNKVSSKYFWDESTKVSKRSDSVIIIIIINPFIVGNNDG